MDVLGDLIRREGLLSIPWLLQINTKGHDQFIKCEIAQNTQIKLSLGLMD